MRDLLRSTLLRRAAFGMYLAWLLVLLLAPVAQSLPSNYYASFDKVLHLGLFFVLALLGHLNVPSIMGVTAVAVVMAGGTEILQGFTAYRSRELWDFVADLVGTGVGLVVAVSLRRFGWYPVDSSVDPNRGQVE